MPIKKEFRTEVRSGRFRIPDASGGVVIIHNPSELKPLYRFYNTDKESFTINSITTPVKENNSMDIVVTGNVTITGPATKKVSGIYEIINSRTEVRSGRFQEKAGAMANTITIVKGVEEKPSYYRVWNTGRDKFKLVRTSGADPVEVNQKCSADVRVKGDLRVRLEPNAEVAGIYDYILHSKPVRSGRISSDRDADFVAHLIDMTDIDASVALYRIFNSGEADILLFRSDDATATAFATVGRRQSLDFALTQNLGTAVYARSAEENKRIRGMYQLLETNE